MDDRFDEEFYRSRLQRVLPIGPGGIQPYVRTGPSPVRFATAAALLRPLAMLAGLAPSAIAFWHQVAISIAPSEGGAASRARCCQ